jgi:Aminoglycoside/hydroxyurea antibiotic resistance kinase
MEVEGNLLVPHSVSDKAHNIAFAGCQPGHSTRMLQRQGPLRWDSSWPTPTISTTSLSPFIAALAEYWSDETLAHIEQWPDTGLVHEGLRPLAKLPRTALTEVVLATDLHAGNVLRAQHQPWLVIDPKPFDGDPAYDAT